MVDQDGAKPVSVSERMAALVKNYRENLPHKVVAMETTWEQACLAGHPHHLLDDLYRQAHNLAGSSAIFGVDGLTPLAHGMEAELKPLVEGHATPTAAQAQAIADWLRQIRACQQTHTG